MGFLFWRRKKRDKEEKKELDDAVDDIRKEFGKAAEWIKHLHSKDGTHEENFTMLNSRLSSLENDVSEIKDFLSFFGPKLFKHEQTASTSVYKQPGVQRVQTGVRTRLQHDFLRNLTTMERAIIWVLLNTELRLSYEDIAALLGKSRATIRGQANSIKQKSEGLIEEVIEKTGKKRVYIPESTKETLLKSMKVEEREKNRGKRIKKRGYMP